MRNSKNYFAKLERLSIAELDRSAEKLVVAEHGNIARLIAHIAKMPSPPVIQPAQPEVF